MVTPGSADFTI